MEAGGIVPVGGRSELRARAARVAELFADWFSALSEATRRNYAQDLDALAKFLCVSSPAEAADRLCASSPLDARDLILRWRTGLRDAGLAPATINRRLSSVRSLYRHVMGAPLVVPSLKAAPRRRVQKGSGGLVPALLAAARSVGGTKALRDVALVLVLADSGLRRAEAASLRIQDLDLPGRVGWVRAKGLQGERAAVDLSVPAVEALRAYFAARGSLDPSAPAFVNLHRCAARRGPLRADGIHSILGDLSRRAGLPSSVRPHDLRRHGAYTLAKNGADAETIRRYGRWSDYRTPARYVGEVAEKGREAVDLLARLREAAGSGDTPEKGHSPE